MFGLLSLGAGVGDGEENREEDVRNLSKSLSALGDEKVRDGGWSSNGFISKPLINGVKRLQENNDARIDGIVRPKGETEQIINNRAVGKPRGAGLYRRPLTPLAASVGTAGDNREADVSTVKRSLGALGFVPEDPFDTPNGFMTAKTDNAVRAFQKSQGLKQDGLLYATGPTQAALTRDVTRLSDRDRAKWKNFHERVAAFNQGHGREIFPGRQDGAGMDEEGVVPAQARRALRETLRRSPAPTWPKSRPWKQNDWVMTPKGPVPNIPGWIRRAIQGEGKPKPGRTPTVIPPAITKGVDPSKERDRYTGTIKPSAPPKLPEKREPSRIDELSKGAIHINPDQTDILRMPVIFESRHGKTSTIEQNKKIVAITKTVGEAAFGEGFVQTGGPGFKAPGIKPDKEFFVRNKDKERLQLKTNKGSSYADISFAVTAKHGNKDVTVQVHIDTYTAKKTDQMPTSDEDRRFVRFQYNLEENTVIVRVPKENAGWKFDGSFYRSVISRCFDRTKAGIEAGAFGPRRKSYIIVEYLIGKRP